jgi:hypothetical protein
VTTKNASLSPGEALDSPRIMPGTIGCGGPDSKGRSNGLFLCDRFYQDIGLFSWMNSFAASCERPQELHGTSFQDCPICFGGVVHRAGAAGNIEQEISVPAALREAGSHFSD